MLLWVDTLYLGPEAPVRNHPTEAIDVGYSEVIGTCMQTGYII